MPGSEDPVFKAELKRFIIEECDKEAVPEEVGDDEPLFGLQSGLELDSMDGLQLSMAMERRFGIKVTDSKEMRRIFGSVNSLADFLRPD